MINKIKAGILSLLLLNINYSAFAKQSVNTTPWGYTGLINMPTADTLGFGDYNISANYIMRNPGFLLNAHFGLFDRLELGVVGGVPSVGFSGFAGNLKYQLIKPTVKMPTSLAVGLNLIGLARDTKLITGNSLYMVLSQDFNWQMPDKSIYNLFSGHVGFSGNIENSRIMIGLDVPITEYVNLEGEFLGKTSSFDEMINVGIKAKPLPYLAVSLLTAGSSISKGFTNTEFILNVSYNGNIPFVKQMQQSNTNEDKIVLEPSDKIITEPVKTPIPKVVPSIEVSPLPSSLPTPKSLPKPTMIPEPPLVSKTPVPEITPEPEPTLIPKIVPTPNLKPTPEPEIKAKTGILKGEIKGSVGGIKPLEVEINLKDNKSTFKKQISSDTNGNYNISGLPKGDYTATFSKPGFITVTKQLIIDNGNTTEINVEMIASNGSVSGRILDKKGNPLEGISVGIDKGKKTITEKNGKFIFNDIPAGYHLLSIYSDNKEVKTFDLDIIAGTELTKELIVDVDVKKAVNAIVKNPVIVKTPEVSKETPKPVIKNEVVINKKGNAGISGKITDKNGSLKGARVMFEGDKLTVMTVSGDDGIYNVKNIAIGTYKMTISKTGYITRIFSVKIKEAKQATHDVKLSLE